LVLAAVVLGMRPRNRYRTLVGVGLVFGATGDLLLELGHFVPGLLAFLVGHLWYLAAMWGVDRRLSPGTAIPFAIWGIGLTVALADGAGDLLLPVAVYAAVLCAAMWRGGSLLGADVPRPAALATFVGLVAFGLSDSLIAIDRFGTDVPAGRWVIMLSYWAAQLLIAGGAIALDGERAPAKDAPARAA
jgi:alkenylglycerophosphocholine/alkenylglycerophosphoethanolamine hydrolase